MYKNLCAFCNAYPQLCLNLALFAVENLDVNGFEAAKSIFVALSRRGAIPTGPVFPAEGGILSDLSSRQKLVYSFVLFLDVKREILG